MKRREFVLGAAATLLSAGTVRGQRIDLTAQRVVDRIRANVGLPWRDKTVDGFKAGDPATVVTGVATTVMATLDVLRRAAAAGRNLVITQEPTFYTAADDPGNRAADPVYLAKKKFIDEQRLVIWRFSDHWNLRQPSVSAAALAATLGWSGYLLPDAQQIYRLPETTLAALGSHVRGRLGLRGGLRTVGQPGMRVRTVFVRPGTISIPGTILNLRRADVILAGEPREWEVVPYILDTWSAGSIPAGTERGPGTPGEGKGMIALGRLVSQTPGMQACAAWIRSLVPEVPVEPLADADPYWSPAR